MDCYLAPHRGGLCGCLLAGAILLLCPFSARGNDPEQAEEHFHKAEALVAEGACDKAVVELKKSYELNPAPIALYNMAVCYDQMHMYVDAIVYFNLYIAKGEGVDEDKAALVRERIDDIKKFIGTLKLHVSVEGADVLIDGKAAGKTPLGELPVETGDHELTVRKTGYGEVKQHFIIVSGETTEITIKAVKDKETGPAFVVVQTPDVRDQEEAPVALAGSGKKVPAAAFWSMLGLTLASGLTMTVTGGLTLRKDNKIAGMTVDVGEDWSGLKDERDALAWTTNGFLGLTAASAAVTLVLFFFTDFKREKKTRTSFNLGPAGGTAGLGLGGTF
jgi:hypothetical protein